jgi:DNA-binding NarL/FixJ family response regulator
MMSSAAPGAIRILLADDHPMVRKGLRLVLDMEPDLIVEAEASDGHEAVQTALRREFDLAILDVAMPRITGLQASRQLRRLRPAMKLLLLSMYEGEQYLLEGLKAGASGYVLKSAADQELVDACRAVMRGVPFLYPSDIPALVREYLEERRDGGAVPRGALTPREEEIVKLIAEGYTSRQIAGLLVIAPKTVESHRANIMQKLAMRDRVEITRYAIRSGLVEP